MEKTVYYAHEVMDVVNDELNKAVCEQLDKNLERDSIIVSTSRAYLEMARRINARFQFAGEVTKDDQ